MPAPTPQPEPRVAHFLFAHRAVPRAFLRNPPAILGILGSAQAMEFLVGMWDVLCGELEPPQRLPSEGLAVHCYELNNDVFAALVTMPPPQRVFEAFHVACCARLEGEHPFARAFTLDLAGEQTDAEPLAGIMEWNAEGEHELLGEVPAGVDPSSFTDAIEAMLAREAEG